MDKELCFCIENSNLYLEQVLVDYKDIPIFFLCKCNLQYYVVLCTDINEFSYIIVKTSSWDVYNLLHGKIPMREIFTGSKEYWEVVSGEEISLDNVTRHPSTWLNISLLPEKNACFRVLTEEIEKFVEKFDSEFLDDGYFKDIGKDIIVDELLDDYTEIDNFIGICNYSFNSQVKHQTGKLYGLDKNYIPDVNKVVVLTENQLSKEWKSSDIIYVAA